MKLVFVSSTFRDMQHERDAISSRLVPKINSYLEKYGESVRFGDLRWGVNTTDLDSELSSRKVLKVCLDEIENSRPYMIVLIGERYGWIPERRLIEEAARLKGIAADSLTDSMSVTALEIEYGAFLDDEIGKRVLFYFRDTPDLSEMPSETCGDYLAESELHRQRLEALKRRIEEKFPDRVKHYSVSYDKEKDSFSGLDRLTETIYGDLTREFTSDIEKYLSLPRERRAELASENKLSSLSDFSYMRECSDVVRFKNRDTGRALFLSYDQSPVLEVIEGELGSGARTTVAQKYAVCGNMGLDRLAIAFGEDEISDVDDMIAIMVYKLCELLGVKSEKKSLNELLSLLETYSKTDRELHIFVLNAPQSVLSLLYNIFAALPRLIGIAFHIHFASKLSQKVVLPFLKRSRRKAVPPLAPDERAEVVRAILKNRRKELSDEVISSILMHEGSDSPLYLSLMTERLLMLDSEDFAAIRALGDGMDNINKYMKKLVLDSGDGIAEISEELLGELSERINPDMLMHVIAHLSCRFHFSEEGIAELFEYRKIPFNSLDFSLFRHAIPSLFSTNSGGMLFFSGAGIKEGAMRLLRKSGMDIGLSESIEYLKTKSEKYRRKALPALLFEIGDAVAFLELCLEYTDCPLDVAYKSDTEGEQFRVYSERLIDTLRESSEEERSFYSDLTSELVARISDGRIKNPYTILSFVFHFLTPDYGSPASVEWALLLALDLADAFSRYTTESAGIAEYILRGLMIPAFFSCYEDQRLTLRLQENNSYIEKKSKPLRSRLQALLFEKKINISSLEDEMGIAFVGFFRTARESRDPISSPAMSRIHNVCDFLDSSANKQAPGYCDRVIAMDREAVEALGNKETQSLFLAINGYRYSAMGRLVESQKYFTAFISLHRMLYSDGFISSIYMRDYISMLTLALESLIDRRKAIDDAVDVFRRTMGIFGQLYHRPYVVLELMRMHRMLVSHGLFDDDYASAAIIYPILFEKLGDLYSPGNYIEILNYLLLTSEGFIPKNELEDEVVRLLIKMKEFVYEKGKERGKNLSRVLGLLISHYSDHIGEDEKATVSRILPRVYEATGEKIGFFEMRAAIKTAKG